MPHDLIPLASLPPGALSTVEIDTVRRFAEEAQAASTRRCYDSDYRIYRAWCAARDLCALPAEPSTIAAFLAAEAEAGRKVSTIGRRLASIRHAHKLSGADPLPTDSQLVRVTLKGVRRSLGCAPVKKAPATSDIIAQMLAACGNDLRGLRDRALISIGFATAMRRSELVALQVSDIEYCPEGARVTIRRSKTDAEGKGCTIGVPHGVRLLPVEHLRRWLEAADITDGPLFRAVTKGKISDAPFSAQSVALRMKALARRVGIEPSAYAGHSLRSGFITSAAHAGASIWKLQAQSRHKSLDVLRQYVHDVEMFHQHAGQGVL